ncbi:MAG: DUF3857 domain-containing protein, partial [Calditrichia bacterium]|nr:DUF3857 domain-containing protein [Calditrichia bacterium]
MKIFFKNTHILFVAVSILILFSGKLFAGKKDAIVLKEIISYHVTDIDKIAYKVYRKIQINNKDGEGYSQIVIHENDYKKLKKVKGEITDKNGKRLKKIKKNDFQFSNLESWYMVRADAWKKFYIYKPHSYPYTIEYEYEVEMKSVFHGIRWMPQTDVPVISSEFILKVNNNFKFKTHSIGIDVEPKVGKGFDETTYMYSLFNIKKRELDDYMPPEDKLQTALYIIPEEFTLGDYTGSYESWGTFTDFIRELIKGRYNLNEKTKAKVRDLVKDAVSDREKIDILYRFLQDRTRYQAIYLDIGGFQPHFAQDVYNNCYGDCKDLSTLMISMLDAVGIKAYPTLILTRDEGVVREDLILSQFNHFIAMVPLQNDTLWLENTADYRWAGDLSYTDEDCSVLVILDDGYKIIKTPISKSSENLYITKFNGKLNSYGIMNFS